jgi:C-terminal processing protease CtpA/Prc
MSSATLRATVCALTLLLAACTGYQSVEIDEPSYSRVQIQQDLDQFLSSVKSTHPDVGYGADPAKLESMKEHISTTLSEEMTSREAWMALAQMNPVFGDAHVGLIRPKKAIADYQASGGTLFPLPVTFDAGGTLRVAPSVSNEAGVPSGAAILEINGNRVEDIVARLAPRMRGETPALRRLVMAHFFDQYFWVAYGGYDRYVVKVDEGGEKQNYRLVAGDVANQSESSHLFIYRNLNNGVGYLNVTTFDIGQKESFAAFLKTSFAQIHADGIESLIIDLRQNGGGAHDTSDQLMAYLTGKTWSPLSRVTARITEANVKLIPGAEIGSVVTVPYQQPVTPPADLPNRFMGNIYALIGGLTYSQAIVFAATLQDFDIATVAGEPTQGPANQTGQIQMTSLARTGFDAAAPIYIFTRANGDSERESVIPDIAIDNDVLEPMASVTELVARVQ